MENNNKTLCLECDGAGTIPDTGKRSDNFRICDTCDGKGYVSMSKIDKTNIAPILLEKL